MIGKFLRYIEFEKRYSEHTLISYRTDLSQFSTYILEQFEETSPEKASFGLIRSWIVSLVEKETSPKSINRKVACLKSFYKFLLRSKVITKDPTLKLKAPKVKMRCGCRSGCS